VLKKRRGGSAQPHPAPEPADHATLLGEPGGTASALSASGSALLDPDSGRDVLLDVEVDVTTGQLEATFRGAPAAQAEMHSTSPYRRANVDDRASARSTWRFADRPPRLTSATQLSIALTIAPTSAPSPGGGASRRSATIWASSPGTYTSFNESSSRSPLGSPELRRA
jgi:hypothetical protein